MYKIETVSIFFFFLKSKRDRVRVKNTLFGSIYNKWIGQFTTGTQRKSDNNENNGGQKITINY